ncbi:MAG: substrate-binding domain-containing protein, partial [Paracoccaceae bacterium]
ERQQFSTNTVLCSNDRLAIGFLTACYERRLRVGRDPDCTIRVAGQDDHPFSRFTCPPLTTIAQDYDSVSRCVVEILFRSIEGDDTPREETLFEGKLIMRASA